MAKNSNKTKSDQLGMPLGTASGRLRKMIMFDLLQRLGEAVCFKCESPIDSVDELSIEHKKPWLHVDPALFWDLNNIAFSHLKCNRPDRPNGTPRREGPEGTAWCTKHKLFLPVAKFAKCSRKWNGLQDFCRDCSNETK